MNGKKKSGIKFIMFSPDGENDGDRGRRVHGLLATSQRLHRKC